MEIRNATREQVQQAADAVGVQIANYISRGTFQQCVLFPFSGQVQYRKVGYSPWTKSGRRVLNAICAHGHEAFYRELFARAPGAVIKNRFTTIRGVDDLERQLPALYSRNVGSQYRPVFMDDTCRCNEDAEVA